MCASDGEYARWNKRFSGARINSKTQSGYIVLSLFNRQISAHRVAFAVYYGRRPDGVIDHINGDKTDNRICNLRDTTAEGNAKNRKRGSNNKTGVPGVIAASHGFRVYASDNKARLFLGTFTTIEEAIDARKNAELAFGYHKNHGRHT